MRRRNFFCTAYGFLVCSRGALTVSGAAFKTPTAAIYATFADTPRFATGKISKKQVLNYK